ncbi:MAG: TlpA family protein disulfide reductase [Actinobacteria bacterium]|nr:MAG: TlpA family protein disulfide reductase [Actinomycetota bacterium]
MTNKKSGIPVAPIAATVVGIALVCLLWVLVSAKPNPSSDADSPLLGEPAPAVVTTTLDDKPFALSRRKGSWVVLNFFNSTCVPCRLEHPLLVTFADHEKMTANPAELYTVINDDSDGAVVAFFADNKGDWQKIRDTDGSIAVAFGVAKVPETWIIDPNGYVRLRIAGQLSKGLLEEQMSLLKVQFGS